MAEATIFSSVARTATADGVDQPGLDGFGLHVIVDVTAVTSTPSVVTKIQGKDPASGKYYDVLSGAAISATGTYVLKIGAGMSPIPGAAAADIVPDTWRVRMEHGNANSITYSVGAVVFRA